MTSKFTREELLNIIDTDHVQCGEASALASMALAAMGSEPVGEFYEDGPLNWYQISDGDRVPSHRRIPLYRHAQPAPVVPEEMTIRDACKFVQDMRLFDDVSVIVMRTWNACRAAMLAAAPQSPGSDPVTVTGKWIPVSERMPIDFEAVIAFDGDQVYGEAMYSSDDGFTIDGYEPCDRLKLQNVTHWMPLPPPPTEVK
ncbi:TPA: DUF551 domain-containing protein [Klebsiella pneumoniae]|nr:DUF551 domain-containing protein [Klebsiella pneumoniae]